MAQGRTHSRECKCDRTDAWDEHGDRQTPMGAEAVPPHGFSCVFQIRPQKDPFKAFNTHTRKHQHGVVDRSSVDGGQGHPISAPDHAVGRSDPSRSGRRNGWAPIILINFWEKMRPLVTCTTQEYFGRISILPNGNGGFTLMPHAMEVGFVLGEDTADQSFMQFVPTHRLVWCRDTPNVTLRPMCPRTYSTR